MKHFYRGKFKTDTISFTVTICKLNAIPLYFFRNFLTTAKRYNIISLVVANKKYFRVTNNS